MNPKLSTIYVDQKKVNNLNVDKSVFNSSYSYAFNKLSNFNTENITDKINLLKNINVTQDIRKTENIVRKITRLAKYNNINQLTENIENI